MCWDEDNIMIVFKFFWSVGSFIIFSFFIAGTSGIVNATTQFVEIPMLTCRASQPLLTARQNVEDEKNKFEVVCCNASQTLLTSCQSMGEKIEEEEKNKFEVVCASASQPLAS